MQNIILIVFLLIILILNIFLILCFREYIFKFQSNNFLNRLSNIENTISKFDLNTSKQTVMIVELINNHMKEINSTLNSSINILRSQSNIDFKMNREELSNSFDKISTNLEKQLKILNETQNNLIISTEKKLDIMRETVDEKLQKTLENRISKSFEFVSKRLDIVHRGIGEMNNLALSINDLRNILSNVKTRGIVGEYQLENILSQILTENQYLKNVITKQNSNYRVEFAIKIPSKNSNEHLLLPIDSKFPLENYTNLLNAYESSNKENIVKYSKLLETSIKKFSKDISEKYIDTNNTTDFAILFLPIESLYSEISKNVSLVEFIQVNYKIIITGPTTLYALLNSLNLAFKTISIEKHSSKVWKTLEEIKKEFENFSNILEKTRDKLEQATNDLNTLSINKTKKIQNKLKNIDLITYD